MATTTTTTTTTATTTKAHLLKVQTQQPILKPKRRKYRETTISSSATSEPAAAATTGCPPRKQLDTPTIVSPDNSWCCPASSSSKPISAPVQPNRLPGPASSSSSSFSMRFSPGSSSPVMDFAISNGTHHSSRGHSPSSSPSSFPSSFTKFNSALTAGLLNPMSPPPENMKARSSPTLFEMMASEPEIQPTQLRNHVTVTSHNKPQNYHPPSQAMSVQDRQSLILQRISEILGNRSPGNQFNDTDSSDVKLTLSSKDGISVSMNVHRQILVAHSRFFAVKLSDRWGKGQWAATCAVEIADCDDVEVYIETLRLMYCKDLRRKLMREDVSRVLGILKVHFSK